MNFTVENVEFFLLILIRMSGFILTAPIFSMKNIPVPVKIALSLGTAILIYTILPYQPLEYRGVIGFAGLVVQEMIFGILLGYVTNICTYILNFSGQLIDMEIGFGMVNLIDPLNNLNITVTGNLYSYFVTMIMIVTNMHHYILKAFIDVYQLIPIGEIKFQANLFEIMLRFMNDYFIIGFRIVLPVFASMLVVNVVLGVLARVAPQMNMFVVGIQLKVFIGLAVLLISIQWIPEVADFIFSEMKTLMNFVIKACMGT